MPHTRECRDRFAELLKGTARFQNAEKRRANFEERAKNDHEEQNQKRSKAEGSGLMEGEREEGKIEQKKREAGEDADDGWQNLLQKLKKVKTQNHEEGEEDAMSDGTAPTVVFDDGEDMKDVMEVHRDDQDECEDEEFERLAVEQESAKGEMDPKKVQEAREEELRELERRVYGKVSVEECWEKTGKDPIGVRWVDVRKPCGRYRSRLVAKDFRPRSRRNDIEGLYASMPPLELVKSLIARAAVMGDKVMLIDIKKAHLYAPIEGEVFVELPPERCEEGMCAKLKFTLYGMRKAASNWEKEYGATLNQNLFVTGKANGSSFYHEGRGIRIVVHGDDFVITGRDPQVQWVRERLAEKYPLEVRAILGPGPRDQKQAVVLNRVVSWTENGIEFRADDSHVEKMLTTMQMEQCNIVTVPGVKGEIDDQQGVPLEGGQLRAYRSVVARANYLAQDRPDIRYVVKELCQKMASPTSTDWHRLKKLCRYLRGRPRIVQRRSQVEDDAIVAYVDSDWAGCKGTRRSTSGGALFAYGMCVKAWSTTQGVTARSSGEAELYAANKGMTEALGLQQMCKDVGVDLKVVTRTDSDACRGTCRRVGLGRLKHLEVEDLWAQQVVRSGRVALERVDGVVNPADLMTKYLPRNEIDQHMNCLGFVDL